MKYGLIIGWLLLALPAHAVERQGNGTACDVAYASLPHDAILDLLDPAAPEERRSAALAAYEGLATRTDCPEFGYTLGQLYRHGPYLPGNPLPQDVEKARALILPMAEDGYLPAYADLAEMEMRHAHAREAMQWTQVYLHFVQDVQADYVDETESARFMRSAYNSHLLARSDLVARRLTRPPLSRRTIREDLDDYLATHGEAVAARMRDRFEGRRGRISAQDPVLTHVLPEAETCYQNVIEGVGSASASWIVEVLPSGETGRVVLENFVPNTETVDVLARCLARYRFSPFEGDRPTTVRVSITMGAVGNRTLQRR
ncbi:hypothetical protein H4F99_04745 [Lysobacter sp. SG-8]|uniref:TonB C-terminal domain-containing protein n=1 Tax=Marilutibacter penaei TaxID=2759900 RepID=A0A7W3YDH6_9GAMM|nr:hypothetical protein [Lysobacter penaei]MBB1087794.1 hypothetical protein [Lysobacter penaei]